MSYYFSIFKICGQKVVTDQAGRFLYFYLHEPWWTAGWKFGWNPPPGISVNEQILKYAECRGFTMCVFVGTVGPDRVYEADPTQWMKFSRERGAIDHRSGVILYVFPWSRFKTRRYENDELLAIYHMLKGEDDD